MGILCSMQMHLFISLFKKTSFDPEYLTKQTQTALVHEYVPTFFWDLYIAHQQTMLFTDHSFESLSFSSDAFVSLCELNVTAPYFQLKTEWVSSMLILHSLPKSTVTRLSKGWSFDSLKDNFCPILSWHRDNESTPNVQGMQNHT